MRSSFVILHAALALLALSGHATAASLAAIHDRPDGVETSIDGTRLRLQFVTDRIVRVTATPNPQWSSRTSMMRVPVLGKPGRISVTRNGATLTLRSAALSVTLNRAVVEPSLRHVTR